MDIKFIKTMLVRAMYIMVILAVAFPVTTVVYAAQNSPFIGQWEAIDIDGGNIRLSIGGRSTGPFNITWTEDYFGFCSGKAGIARGIGWLNTDDPYLLEADLHLTCFTTGAQIDFHPVWRYDPSTGWLTSQDDDFGGFVTTWHHPGASLPLSWQNFIAHPDQEWVEGMGFSEGKVVSLVIYDSSGEWLFAGTTVAGYPEWDPNNIVALFFLDFDLKAGDHLWMSDGMVAKDLIITTLQITETSLAKKTVSGIAEPGSEVIIEYFPQELEPVMFSVFADQDGLWTADVPWLTPSLDGLASQADADGDMTRLVFGVPRLDLRVNYGDDWVESFYEAGHTISLQVTDSEGNVKATAEVSTAPRDEWGGAEGFQTRPENWVSDVPDIQPNDWVRAQVDNDVTAQVQIGEINGIINLATDSIEGAITAPWFLDEVQVECHSWGAPLPEEILKYDMVLPDGKDKYSCSWDKETEWDIQPGQNVGVGYIGPDGNWVANYFFEPATIIVTSKDDVLTDDGVCTLREAVIAANINSPSGNTEGECPGGLEFATDTILLAPDTTYALTIDGRDEDDSFTGDLDIQDNLSVTDLIIRVEGGGHAIISQDASEDDRVLDVRATVEIEGLTLSGGGNVGSGGGVFNNGKIEMRAGEVSGNSVGWAGGGIFNNGSGTLIIDTSNINRNSSDAFGGGITNWGVLVVNNSEITGNTDVHGGGGINNEKDGTLTIDNSVLSSNSSGQGGALYNSGTATITNGTVVGGTIAEEANIADGGGGLFNIGIMTVDGSIVTGNRASYGGGLFNWTGGMLTVSNSTVSFNSANEGGGLHNKEGSTAVIQNGTVISNNYAEWGSGGIDNWGTITITESILRDNNSPGEGDAIGSGAYIESVATVTGSCIVGNGDIAVFTDQTNSLDFTGNWWGDPTGPSGEGTGSGDSVGTNINFSPWLLEPPDFCVNQ